MNAHMKKLQDWATIILSTTAVVSLVGGLLWRAYGRDAVAETAKVEVQRVISDSLKAVQQAHEETAQQVQILTKSLESVPEDIGLIKDILVDLGPERYKKVKEKRALKK
jgi:hypothetical protein